MYRKVGGHPKTIELLNGWLKDGSVTDLLTDAGWMACSPPMGGLFLAAAAGKADGGRTSRPDPPFYFPDELDEAELAYAEVDEAMVRRWLDLSLLQRERGEAPPLPPQMAALLEMLPPAEQAKAQSANPGPDRYTVHPVVAEYLLAQTTADERQSLHRWAAAFYGQPFVEIARNHIAQSGQTWTEERIERFARDADGVVGQMVARTDDMGQARGAMARALAWQGHLFAAGEVDAAGEIVTAVYAILARWGERDRAKGLLRRSIASLEGVNQAVAQGNLATLLQDEGKLAEALATYQEVYETFAALDAKQQMAAALSTDGDIYQDHGKY